MKTVNIHIGDYYSASEPSVIVTVLGPCVATCLYDPSLKIGGMNHILLPGDLRTSKDPLDGRYAVNAMELLINQMMKLGANRYKLQAKVFGGASILSFLNEDINMGIKNVNTVVDFLITEKIPIINYNFGGNFSRKIFFYTSTGDVLIKKIKSSIAKNEYSRIIKKRKEIEDKISKTGHVMYLD